MKELRERDCNGCNPLKIGWCSYIYKTKGKMLDEKCPKVKAFVDYVQRDKQKVEVEKELAGVMRRVVKSNYTTDGYIGWKQGQSW